MKIKGIDVDSIKWSQPLTLRKWCLIYGLNYPRQRNTMSRWFKDQTIRNQKLSSQYYRVDLDDLPGEYIAQVLFSEAVNRSNGSQREK